MHIQNLAAGLSIVKEVDRDSLSCDFEAMEDPRKKTRRRRGFRGEIFKGGSKDRFVHSRQGNRGNRKGSI